MNIEEAKEELRHTVEAYLKKEDGEYCIAPIRQRPVFLMGPPGIGKTQIMEQIARECNIGFSSVYDHASYQTECCRSSVY